MTTASAGAQGYATLRRWLAPVARVFGPQTSSAARERRDTLVLLAAVTLVVVPHFEHLPWWATAVVVLLLVWRIWLTITQRSLPGRFVMVPLLLAAGGAVYIQHRTLAGQEAGVTFLLLLMALKLLEMRARRDIFVVIFLSFFILLTQFLYGQGLPVAAMTVAAVIALFFVLVSVNLDEVDLPAARKLRLVGLTLAKALPLTVALFVLFPRFSGPLWGMPGESGRGKTGLSDSMSPGSISRLLDSDEIAFRVSFDNAVPGKDKLYWRGPVFGTYTGRTWLPLANRTFPAADPTVEPDRRSAVTYSVTLEPHKRDWLFALEALGRLPTLPQFEARLTSDMRLLANGLITSRMRYDATSYTSYRLDANLSPPQLQDWLVLPAGFNPRTVQFAQELRDQVLPGAATERRAQDVQLVNAVLEHFRRGGYGYTLEPPALGRNSIDEFLFDTRLGFCEHYASAFVFLMRVAGGAGARRDRLPGRRAEPGRWLHDRAAVRRARLGRSLAAGPGLGPRRSDGRRRARAHTERSGRSRAPGRPRIHGNGHRCAVAALAALQLGSGGKQLEPVGADLFDGAAAGAGRATRSRTQAGERHPAAGAHHGRTARVARVRLAATATRARSAGCVLPVAARAARTCRRGRLRVLRTA